MSKKKTNKYLRPFKKIIDFFDMLWFRTRDNYLSVRAWFRHCFTKTHFKFIKEAWCSYPWDWCHVYRVERAQFVDMLSYFEHAHITTEETYAEMIKWLRLLIKLNDIILEANGVDLFEYEGHMIFEELPKGELYEMKGESLIYHSKVNVNMKNAERFAPNKQMLKYIKEHSHELYRLKAKHLYHTIKERYLELMWD